MVEENIVAVTVAVEVVEEIVGAGLQVVGQAVDLLEVGKPDVEFNEADQRLIGDGKFDAAVAADDNSFEAGRGDVGAVVEVAKADDLHVGVANASARVETVVFEEQNRGEFTAVDHVQPIFDAETDNPVKVVLGI